ncbi:MAG TPA: tetratricopeptide repeat protein [Rhizomicrobium sp.]
MTDIFHEVEEEVRRERLEQFWKKHSDYIIAGMALIVIAVAGFQLWRVYDQKQRVRASNEYTAAVQMLQSGQSNLAAELFAKLGKSAPRGYSAASRLQEADALLSEGNRADAIALYKQIAAGSDPDLGAVARLHAAWAIVDQAPKSEVTALVGPLTAAGSAWNPMAREILAYADYRAGNAKAANEYESLAADTNAPDGVRQRARIVALFLKAGGDRNFGKVPAPAPPAQSPGANPTGAGGPPSR